MARKKSKLPPGPMLEVWGMAEPEGQIGSSYDTGDSSKAESATRKTWRRATEEERLGKDFYGNPHTGKPIVWYRQYWQGDVLLYELPHTDESLARKAKAEGKEYE